MTTEPEKNSLSTPPELGSIDSSMEVVARLSEHRLRKTRYREEEMIGRGGMGAILRIWDEDLRRNLAMKVVLDRGEERAEAQSLDKKALGRFLEEAQVTAQLDHPGIVPVHELGIDDQGSVYFTMQLVKGQELQKVFELVEKEEEGWSRTRALMVLLKVCDAVSYAHAKGVIHRDLKPENVMVGRFGEVYVMDWGLARVLGHDDTHDLRLEPQAPSAAFVQSDRAGKKQTAEEVDETLYTMDGDVVGTPAYMAPEQARGQMELIGPRSDVYSMGCLLYQLLSGQPPYLPKGARVPPITILQWLLEGPPKPLEEVSSGVPGELVAICDKAMSREPEGRYEDMTELAADLRAYLEDRVVAAYETGALAQLKKWIRRNRGLATAWATAFLLLVVGLAAVGWVQHEGKLAEQGLREVAQANEAEARLERTKVFRLSAFQILGDLRQEARELWPMRAANLEAYDAWLTRARALVTGLDTPSAGGVPSHRTTLAEVRGRGREDAAGAWSFDDPDDAWWHVQLVQLIDELEAFGDPETGAIAGLSPDLGWGIERRREFAASIEERSVTGEHAARLWDEAARRTADAGGPYGGVTLEPVVGLLPLGPDPASGLEEFAVLATGEAPEREGNRAVRVDAGSAVVLVLLPGGPFAMGSQKGDEVGVNFDPDSDPVDEGPVHEVTLAPYFLAKHELTQAQWKRMTGETPSRWRAYEEPAVDDTNPVEQVSWRRATEVLAWFELALPTEAQWEFAARGGAESPWWTGAERETLDGAANVADEFAALAGASWNPYEAWLNDGFYLHAPVGSFDANPYGLFDVNGNVFEWCRDRFGLYALDVAEGTGERLDSENEHRAVRGGAFNTWAGSARSANRESADPDLVAHNIGIRAGS